MVLINFPGDTNIHILQKQVVRFIAKIPYGAHTKVEFHDRNILKDQIRQV